MEKKLVVLVDTNILIQIGNKDKNTVEFVKDLEMKNHLSISIVTEMEMLVGCRNKIELHNLDRFLKRFFVYKITDPISDLAKELIKKYYLSHGLKIPDALIASTALKLDIPLLTINKKDFQFINGIKLLNS
ncbi:MAG: type II toxin-antitoxin system VapC family toxin [Leptospiraceae bacterium]|nr:type II toxin-antitoxin system VapC family toxin [Leptospiraceae bacterium]